MKKYAHLTEKKFVYLTDRMGAGAIASLTIGVIVMAMLIGGHRSSQSTDIARVDRQAAKVTTQDGTGTPAAISAEATAPAVESTATAESTVPELAPVTITGCLERSDATFRLRDTSGAAAPKSRSWKSGFLKKGSASVEVVDGRNRVKLPAHVGQRVSVTGTLVDHELQVRSLQRVAASCTNSPKVRI